MTIKAKTISKAKAEQRRLEWLTFHLIFDVLDQQVKKQESCGQWGKAGEFVEEAKSRFQNMGRGKWRTRYLEELEKRHPLFFWGEIIPQEVKDAVAREIQEEREDQVWEILSYAATLGRGDGEGRDG